MSLVIIFTGCNIFDNNNKNIPEDLFKLLWAYPLSTYSWGPNLPPTVLSDSLLVWASDEGLNCISLSSGNEKWKRVISNNRATNAYNLAHYGSWIYFYLRGDGIYSLDLNTGENQWHYGIGDTTRFCKFQAATTQGYFVSIEENERDYFVLALDQAGNLNYKLPLNGCGWSVWENSGKLYVARGWLPTSDGVGNIISYDENTKETSWVYNSTGGAFAVASLIFENDILYAGTVWGGSLGNEVVALDAGTGEKLWSTDSYGVYQVVLAGDVLYCNLGGGVLALDKTTGARLWETHLPVADENSALAYWDGYLYNSVSGGLYIFDAGTGEVVHKTLGPDNAYIYQVSAGAGKIFVQSSRHLYAFAPYEPGR